jgi:hypothetical protein
VGFDVGPEPSAGIADDGLGGVEVSLEDVKVDEDRGAG